MTTIYDNASRDFFFFHFRIALAPSLGSLSVDELILSPCASNEREPICSPCPTIVLSNPSDDEALHESQSNDQLLVDDGLKKVISK